MERRQKQPSRRALSIAHWHGYSDARAFLAFLSCLSKRDDIPKLPKDIKQLLFAHVKRLLSFHIPPSKKSMDLVNEVFVAIPANTLQCHKLLIKCMGGKSLVRIQCQFQILSPEVANEIRSIEDRISDSLPREKGTRYRRRLNHNNILFLNRMAERFFDGEFGYVPSTGENVEAQAPVNLLDMKLEKGHLLHLPLEMSVTGVFRNKKNHLWSMCYSLY